LTLFIRSRLKS